MLLDDVLNDAPIRKAPGAVNLIDGVRDTKTHAGALTSTSIKLASPEFFGSGDSRVTFDLSTRAAPKFDISAPIVPVPGASNPDALADPLAGALQSGPLDISRPAAALLDTFAPDISDLSRTGLPLSGVDIPDEKAIREQLRKILRRL